MIPEYIVTITQNDGTQTQQNGTTTTVNTGGAQGPPGAPGEPGPPGPPGSGSGSTFFFEQNFASPLTEWTVVHNQNTYGVVVETFLPNGDPYEGTVTYPDLNTVKINWYYPTSGYARVFN